MHRAPQHRRRRRSSAAVVTAATALIASLFTTGSAHAAPPKPPKAPAQQRSDASARQRPEPSAVPPKDRDRVLGKGWKSSADRAVTAVADSDGLHLLVADSKDGYAWRTAAVLSEPQLPADTWIGNQCVMDDHHAAVAYAPRTFTNKPDLMMGGGLTAIVNLDDGSVTKLPFTASLAYFDPTCNPVTHTAVFTALREARTRLVTVDTKGATVADTTAPGEITSAVPTRDGVVAAAGNRLVHVDRAGRTTRLTATRHAPYGIRVSGDGTVSYLDRTGDTDADVQTWAAGRRTTVASGRLTEMNLRQGTDGTVYLTGEADRTEGFTASGIAPLRVPADADVSTRGRLAVDPVVSPAVHAGIAHIEDAGRGFTRTTTTEPAAEETAGRVSHVLTVTGTVPGTGRHTRQQAPEPGGTAGGTPSPALTGSPKPRLSTLSTSGTASTATTITADARAHDPVDTDAWCSVPRNDIKTLALQPTPNQVEWAVDMAVRGNLRSGYLTQGGWRAQTGLSTIDPQGLFPRPELVTGGRIPAQVELGILAQESNLWQAESGAIPGQMGSPLAAVDGYYGHQSGGSLADYWVIHWEKSDCGYGVGQVTDGMRKAGYEKEGETSLPASTQRAVALDYATNIAASLYILADKWNEVHRSGQTIAVNNDDPAKPENWFTAVWNYNLGFNEKADEQTNGNWGLGWYNNPANPVYPASRKVFMNTDVDPYAAKDAAHPQDWPYEEKVMGWAAWSIDTGHSYATSGRQDWPGESGFSSAGFRPAYWNGTDDAYFYEGSARYNRAHVTPPLDTFCNTKNNCDTADPPHCPDAACYTQYWWHESNATWKSDCATTCGFENIKYQTLISEPGRGTRLQYGAPVCSGAPAGSLVVDSVPAGTETWGGCQPSASKGSFQFTFEPNPAATGPGFGQYEAKADLHQIGGGYGGHFWYTHTRDAAHLGGDGGLMTVTGTWTLGQSLGWARVFVHLPDTGAQTQQAHYVVRGVEGGDRDRRINTHYGENTWAELGVYHFTGTPRVELSNSTEDGTAEDDVAFSSVAFQSLPGKPKHMVVAMGDSYSSGEGSGSYSPESDTSHGTDQWNACRRGDNSWPRKVILPDQSSGLGALADAHSSSVDFQNVTCSGAKTWQLTSGDPSTWGLMGNYHEKTQIDSGVLSPDTTLVMLTIGGNDGDNFTDAVTNCYVIGVCDRDDYTGNADQAVTATGDLIGEIQTAAPNAQIVLMGYPHIVSDQPCVTADFDSLNYLADYLRDKQKAKVEELKKLGVKVDFADPIPAFKGHGICDSDEWINRIVAGPNGDGDFHQGDDANQLPCIPAPGDDICLSLESFHPKNAGTTGYAQVMDQELADLGYKGA
ncbi:SGNH/GDSL hydrolase family protein [Streptomyces mexicanus]|uniref:SGNH/GDSL hydrolase family protein n=1 Tax=Streptomyces mexicanus TaxID=178566 RepID=UPI0031EAE091